MILEPGRSIAPAPVRYLLPSGPSDGGFTGPRPEQDPRRAADRLGRLLVVEDDWFIGMEIESAALAARYEVVEIVTTAEEAVAAALRHAPDLVLMDIRLAGKRDGVEAALEIRERADIPCLFVSAHQDAEVRRRAERAKPAGWLSKPFSDAQLVTAIKDALASGRAAT